MSRFARPLRFFVRVSKRSMRILGIAVLAVLVLCVLLLALSFRTYRAVATLSGEAGGVVHFAQTGDELLVDVDVRVPEGGTLHGFHVHEFGDRTAGCGSMGAHFGSGPHGSRHGRVRHAGDLGNLRSDVDGRVRTTIRLSVRRHKLSVDPRSRHSIIGRGIVLHAHYDDEGRGGDAESRRTGNAGARMACGVIGLTKVTP